MAQPQTQPKKQTPVAAPQARVATQGHLLATEKLAKQYGGRPVVNGVSIFVKPGEIVGLLGPNGAGKTTTFNMVVGIVKPDFGIGQFFWNTT